MESEEEERKGNQFGRTFPFTIILIATFHFKSHTIVQPMCYN